MALSDEHIIQAAIQTGLIDPVVLEQLRKQARRKHFPLISLIQAHYRLPMTALYHAVAEQHQIPFLDLAHCHVDSSLLKKLPGQLLRRKHVLPVRKEAVTYLIVSDPNDRITIDTVQRSVGQVLPVAMSDLHHLTLLIDQSVPAPPGEAATVAGGAPDLVALLDSIFRDAYLYRASDIHFVMEKQGLRVRLRMDGILRDLPLAARDKDTATGLISRIKVLAGLDIAEQREPQDGGFNYHLAEPIDKEFTIRVATAPTRYGERITMRLLDQESGSVSLSDLGFLPTDLQRLKNVIHQPYGMILLTGPTGSGKSTTLFAALSEINTPEINIMTVENPIEYVLDGASQIQTGHKISFADALRSLLRHDPDVLMVGEIRDFETADVAVKAAMTGHMVFSTLHTNNAVSAVTRLIDIGCEAFLIGSVMTAVIAQRLIRRLCPHCRKSRPVSAQEMEWLGMTDAKQEIYDPVGCALCQGSGFQGRLGLFETLWFDEKLARLVAQGGNEEQIEALAVSQNNLKFMWQDGCAKVLDGLTTLEEVRTVATFKPHPVTEAA